MGQRRFKFNSGLVWLGGNGGSDLAQIWFRVGFARRMSVVQMRFLVHAWFMLLNFGFPFESDVVHFGFRGVSVWVQLDFNVRSSLASFGFSQSWSTFGAHVLHTRFGCLSSVQLWCRFGFFCVGSIQFKFGSLLVHTLS